MYVACSADHQQSTTHHHDHHHHYQQQQQDQAGAAQTLAAATPTPAPRSSVPVARRTRTTSSDDTTGGTTTADPPSAGADAEPESPSIATLPSPPLPPPAKPPSRSGRGPLPTPPSLPGSELSLPPGRCEEVQSTPDVPPPLAPRRKSAPHIAGLAAMAGRRALPLEPPSITADDIHLLNQRVLIVPPSDARPRRFHTSPARPCP